MSGFDKIDLATKENKQQKKEKRVTMPRKKNNSTKTIGIIGGVILLTIIFIVFLVVIPAKRIYSQARAAIAQARIAGETLKQENIEQAAVELDKTKTELQKTQDDLAGIGYLQFVPIAGWYYNDANHLLKAGGYGINAAEIAVNALRPYADLLGLHGKGTFTGGTAQQRIQTAVLTMEKITPKIDEVESQLVLVRKEIDAVDPNHYPSIFVGKTIRDQITQARLLTDESTTFISQAKPLVKVLPQVLGQPNDQKYLVLFQNDAERRATGGFITAYAIFRVSQGVIHVDASNDIYTLDGTIGGKPTAPRPILQYLPNVPQLNLRDTNLSPDFKVSMDSFNSLYKKAGGYQKVDGIIAIDTHVLVSAMNILGDISTGGVTYTTKENTFCHCPDVVYQLEVSADRPVNYVRADRKSAIGDLMYAIMNKAFASSPRLYWGPLFQSMITEVNQKHIIFDLYNNDAQTGLEALNAAGRIQDAPGDYLHINDVNFGGAKANMFTSESIDQKYNLNSDGSINKTVSVTYKNPYPPSDCNLERGGLCLNAPLRNWLRIYVPKGSQLVDSQGSEVKITSYDELGKTVFEGFLIPRPLGTATFTITYKLPFKLANDSMLPLLIQKQPGVVSEDMTIEVNGHQVDNNPLVADRTLKLNLR